jgi:hypothetical protein
VSTHAAALDLEDVAVDDGQGVVRVPQLVKGEPLLATRITRDEIRRAEPAGPDYGTVFRVGDATVRREPVYDAATAAPTGEVRYLVFARPDPARLVETDPAALARTLYALPFAEVQDFAEALRLALARSRGSLLAQAGAAQVADPRALAIALDLLPALLDRGSLAEAVDRDLGMDGVPGTRLLDGWVAVDAVAPPGFTARIGQRLGRAPGTMRPSVRAMPTRQLHITAGNSPMVPFLSFLRGLMTKGACTLKSAADTTETAALLGAALRAADPQHPITRHTSVVYWPGGDPTIEGPLFAPGAYDRVVVWGSAETVRSVRQRSTARTVVLAPRYGVSLVGREAQDRLPEAAHRACIDTLIWEQKACTASLVHYVEGTEREALAYCEALQRALAQWDALMPRPLVRAQIGRLRLLRRGPLLQGTWFENGRGADLRSAVVYTPVPFDLALHPMSRFVVVRRVETLEAALPWIGSAVATAGVFPACAMMALRDALAAAGVGQVFPLGDGERVWAGKPHDGMRILSELVSWVSSAEEGPEGEAL